MELLIFALKFSLTVAAVMIYGKICFDTGRHDVEGAKYGIWKKNQVLLAVGIGAFIGIGPTLGSTVDVIGVGYYWIGLFFVMMGILALTTSGKAFTEARVLYDECKKILDRSNRACDKTGHDRDVANGLCRQIKGTLKDIKKLRGEGEEWKERGDDG